MSNSTKILIVDDSPSSRALIREELAGIPDSVVYEAENGHQAMSMAIELEPDAITMDVEMPEMDGIATIKRIRYYPQCSHIPIVVISSSENHGRNAEAFHAGAVEFIHKPFAPGALRGYLEDLLAHGDRLQDMRVLVVDDSRSVRTILGRILRKQGATVLECTNGIEALEKIESEPIDLVITDFVMPKMDGLEMCRRVRQGLHLLDLPIVILTAAGEYSVVIEAIKAGANDYLVKPFSREELLSRVENHAHMVRHQREMMALQRRLVQTTKLVSLGSIATGLAHEINNPLGIIKLSVTVATKNMAQNPEKAQRALERIDEHVNRIASLIHQLRQFARTSQQTGYSNESPKALLESTLELHRQQLQGRGIDLIEEYPADDAMIYCVPGQLQHVLVELLGNARDALQPQGDPKQIQVRLQIQNDRVTLEIKDNGPGIPAEILKHIEDPFFTTKDPGRGTGLGLSICSSIIQDQGGTFKILSKEGQGTLVRIEYPVAEETESPNVDA